MRTVLQSISILAFAIFAFTAVAQPKIKSDWQQTNAFDWSVLMGHISPDGMLATRLKLGDQGQHEHVLDVLSLPSGSVAFSVPITFDGNPLCFALNSYVSFSADSKTMAAIFNVTCMMGSNNSWIEIWDTETQTQTRVLNAPTNVDASLSADGSRLLMQLDSEAVSRIINVQTGAELSTIPTDYYNYGSPNGDLIAAYSGETKISKIYDFDGNYLFSLSGFVKNFSLDGLHLGIFDFVTDPYNISVWDVEANNKASTWATDNPKWNYILAIYGNYGLFNYIGPQNGFSLSRLEMRDIQSGDVIWSKEEHIGAEIFEAAVSPDRTVILIAKYIDRNGPIRRAELQSIDPETGDVIQTIAELEGDNYESVFISDIVFHSNNRFSVNLNPADGPAQLTTFER